MSVLFDSTQLKPLLNGFLQTAASFSTSLLSAILVLAAGAIFASWASRRLSAWLSTLDHFDQTFTHVVEQLTRYGILTVTGILVLAQFGVQTASIIAVLGAAGLAIGLALQGTLQNVAAGIMLLVIRPFKVGDWIEAGGVSGGVDGIGLFMTRLHNFEDIFIAVPNSKIWSDTIINYSTRPRRRLVLGIGISYDDDIDRAIAAITALLEADERILAKPDAPRVIVKNYGDSSIDLEIRAWAKRTEYWEARFAITRALKAVLDEAGISIPYPHRQIIVRSAEASAAPALALEETGLAPVKGAAQAAPAQIEAAGTGETGTIQPAPAKPAKAATAKTPRRKKAGADKEAGAKTPSDRSGAAKTASPTSSSRRTRGKRASTPRKTRIESDDGEQGSDGGEE